MASRRLQVELSRVRKPKPRLALLLLIALSGCGGPKSSAPPVVAATPPKIAPADPWLLTCLDPKNPTPALLWNGQIGIRIGRDGNGPGPMFLIDEYETTGEEKIKPVECPILVEAEEGSNILPMAGTNPGRDISDYSQVLDMRTGIVTTKWTAPITTATHPNRQVLVTCEAVLHPQERVFAERWTLIAHGGPADFNVGTTHPNPISSSLRKDGLFDVGTSSYKGLNGDKDMLWAEQSKSPVFKSSAVPRNWPEGKPFVCDLIWSFGRSSSVPREHWADAPKKSDSEDVFPDIPEGHRAYEDLSPVTFDQVAQTAKAEWAKRWKTDIEIDGPVEDQQAVRSFLFYLRSAIDPNGRMSISPYGLSNSQYNGHVFWDADIWVFPALAFIEPLEAQAIIRYRSDTMEQAMANATAWKKAGRPTASGHVETKDLADSEANPIMYPWESSVSGKETVPGPSKWEHHITGSIAFTTKLADALGLGGAEKADRWIRKSAREFSLSRSDSIDGRLEIRGVMSPDENHTGDNDLYTNLLAQWCVNGGNWESPRASETYKLPHDNISFLTYDNDPLKGYKQAAAILSIYPLQYPPAEKEAKVMMDRFADKVIKNGPAMTDSLHALIWARIGKTERAYQTWEKSWRDFVKEPMLQFSEKRNKTSTYFTTGAAGCLQTVIYGFLGFRIDSKKQDGAVWSTNLALGQILSLKPNLPKSWKSVKFKNFIVQGRPYTLIASHNGVQVIQGDK